MLIPGIYQNAMENCWALYVPLFFRSATHKEGPMAYSNIYMYVIINIFTGIIKKAITKMPEFSDYYEYNYAVDWGYFDL